MDRYEAERLERSRALRLAEAGFTVRSDGVIPKVPLNRLRLFDALELAAVEDHFDRAVFAVVARRLRALRAKDVAAVLVREPGVDVGSLIQTPSEDVGRFAHVEPEAVAARVDEIVKRGWLQAASDGTLSLPAR